MPIGNKHRKQLTNDENIVVSLLTTTLLPESLDQQPLSPQTQPHENSIAQAIILYHSIILLKKSTLPCRPHDNDSQPTNLRQHVHALTVSPNKNTPHIKHKHSSHSLHFTTTSPFWYNNPKNTTHFHNHVWLFTILSSTSIQSPSCCDILCQATTRTKTSSCDCH